MTTTQTQKAAVVPKEYAQNEVQEREIYSPNAGEVLIKINSTAINPVDWKMRDFNKYIKSYPAICGSDAAGEVVSEGPMNKKFNKGDRVFFQGKIGTPESSTFQQYCVMPADLVAKTPQNVTDDEAAGVSLASLAVITGLYHESGGRPIKPCPWEQGGDSAGKGKSIIILGGSSSVGQYAIQLARLSGFSTIVTNASSKHIDYLKSLGATHVLDRATASVDDYVDAALGQGHALHFLYDAISGDDTQLLAVQILQSAYSKTSDAASQIIISVYMIKDEAKKLAEQHEPQVAINFILGLGSAPEIRPLAAPFMQALGGDNGWLAKGLFRPNKPQVVKGGLGALEEALALNKKGVSGVKVVINPQE